MQKIQMVMKKRWVALLWLLTMLVVPCWLIGQQLGGTFNPSVGDKPNYWQDTGVKVRLLCEADGAALPTPKDSASKAQYEAPTDKDGKMSFVVEVTISPGGSPTDEQLTGIFGKLTLKSSVGSAGKLTQDGSDKKKAVATVTATMSGDTKDLDLKLTGTGTPGDKADSSKEQDLGTVKVAAGCPCNTCSGKTEATNGSLDLSIHVGGGQSGTSGKLWTRHLVASADMFQRKSLNYVPGSEAQTVKRTTDGAVRQILTETAFVDLVDLAGTNQGYEVRFFNAGEQGALSGGFYAAPSSTAYKVVRMSNLDPTGVQINQANVVENPGASNELVHGYVYDATLAKWTLTDGGLRQENKSEVAGLDADGVTPIIIITDDICDGAGVLLKRTVTKLKNFAFGRKPFEEVVDPNGANLKTTYEYYVTGINGSMLKQQTNPDGSWVAYQYDDAGRTVREERNLTATSRRVIQTTYSTANPMTTEVESVDGTVVARRWTVVNGLEVINVRTQNPVVTDWTNSTNLKSVNEAYAVGSGFTNKPKRSISESGGLTLYQYALAGGNLTTTQDEGTSNAGGTAVVDGTRTVTTTNAFGHTTAETRTDIASGLTLSSWAATSTDNRGRTTTASYTDGASESWVYDCCHLTSHTDRQGLTTIYGYDALGRQTEITQKGIKVRSVLDALGNVLRRERVGTNGAVMVLETNLYDGASRLYNSKDGLLNPTGIVYANGGLLKTTTYPDGGTRVEESNLDGRLKQISGTAVSPSSFEYGTWSGGEWTTDTKVGENGAVTEWVKTYYDAAGHAVKTEYPDGAVATQTYNNLGQLVKKVDPDNVTMLYAYDGQGNQNVMAVDIDRNGVIADGGTDRIIKTVRSVLTAHGTTVKRTVTNIYATASSATSTTVNTLDQSADGLKQWQTQFAQTTSVVQSLPASGNWTTTTTNPDSTQIVQTYTGGRLTGALTKNSVGGTVTQTGYSYDVQGRLASQTDGRTGTTQFSYDAKDKLLTTTAPAPNTGGSPLVTTNGYDTMGHVTSVTLPDATVTNSQYYPTGLLKQTSGSQTYTVDYAYDPQGRMKTMITQGASGSQTTTWSYHLQRGWLVKKLYADGTFTQYSDTVGGRLYTRTWARTNGAAAIVTTYGYNNAGELASLNYSDGTPDVTNTYTRWGAQASMTDATGTRTFTYTSELRLNQEVLPATFYTNRVLTRKYEGSGTGLVPGRDAGFQIGSSATPNGNYDLTYGYDNAGRLQNLTDAGGNYNYAFVPNSNLKQSVTLPPNLSATFTYETGRNQIASVENKQAATTISKYAYSVNALGQRSAVVTSGTTFASPSANSFIQYGYKATGELMTAKRYAGTNPSVTTTPVASYDYGYTYDGIGNRSTSSASGATTSYASNSVNVYTSYTKGSQTSTPVYDLDGNMTRYRKPNNGDAMNFTWDAENRLLSATPATPVAGDKKVINTYDGLGRRARKQIFTWSNGAWVAGSNQKFLYDGWNLVAIYDAANNNALVRTFTWGRDLSGTIQGAGGVGGLLSCREVSVTPGWHYYLYDANGNVTNIGTSATSGGLTNYEYDPYGNITASAGNYLGPNCYTFSTKYQDEEVGLLYYGHRFYHPVLGRWISRDPIEELGGPNPFNFVKNSPVNLVDVLGFYSFGPGYGVPGIPDGTQDGAGSGDKALQYAIASQFVSGEFSLKLLHRYIYEEGDWTLSKDEVTQLLKPNGVSLTKSGEYRAKLKQLPIPFSGKFTVPAKDISNSNGGLGTYAIHADVKVSCGTDDDETVWHASGTATISDDWNFDIQKGDVDSGKRTWRGEAKTWAGSYISGQAFKIKSDDLNIEEYGDVSNRDAKDGGLVFQ